MSRVETLTEPTRRMLGVLSAAPRSMTHDDLAAVADMTELDLERFSARGAAKTPVSYKPTKPAMAFAMRSCARRPMTRCLWASAGACTSGSRARSKEARTSVGDPPSQLLSDRAYHWYHAGDERRALQAAVEAGIAADDVSAHAEALTRAGER